MARNLTKEQQLTAAKENAVYWMGVAQEAQRRGRGDIAAQAQAEYEASDQRAQDLISQSAHSETALDEAVKAWLGPAADELTEEATERFLDIWREVEGRYPDEETVQGAVLSAALQYLLGEATVQTAAVELAEARVAQRSALEAGKQIALMAIEDGMDEQDAAAALGVSRTTMRRAAGKTGS